MKRKNVGIYIYDDAEVLDFAGPFEVFAVADEIHDFQYFNVFTVAKTLDSVTAVNGLSVNPGFCFSDVPAIDILILAGGSGSRDMMEDVEVLRWISAVHQHTEISASICSGARFFAALGLLHGEPYCTHHEVYEHIKEIAPSAVPQKKKRFTNFGKVYTSGGISAGIDLSFHIVEKLLGKQVADATAKYMEYSWSS